MLKDVNNFPLRTGWIKEERGMKAIKRMKKLIWNPKYEEKITHDSMYIGHSEVEVVEQNVLSGIIMLNLKHGKSRLARQKESKS